MAFYTNKPRVAVRFRSEIHFGALILNVQGEPSSFLDVYTLLMIAISFNKRDQIILDTMQTNSKDV